MKANTSSSTASATFTAAELADMAEFDAAREDWAGGSCPCGHDVFNADADREADDANLWGGNDVSEFDGEPDEPMSFENDVQADADALASAGYGTDEDYGYYGVE